MNARTEPAALLASLLGHKAGGDLGACGCSTPCLPHIEVQGIGVLSLPLPPPQRDALTRAAAEVSLPPAPKRAKKEPVPPPSRLVGREAVRLRTPVWDASIHAIAALAASGLGVEGEVSAHFAGILVATGGPVHLPALDGEKGDGTIGALLVRLPTAQPSFQVTVRLGDRERSIAPRGGLVSDVTWAAWITGSTAVLALPEPSAAHFLVYRLQGPPRARRPSVPDLRPAIAEATRVLTAWAASSGHAARIVYALNAAGHHPLTGASGLKGTDLAVLTILTAAAEAADCRIGLCTFALDEAGTGEETGRRSRKTGRVQFVAEEITFEESNVLLCTETDGTPILTTPVGLGAGSLLRADVVLARDADIENWAASGGWRQGAFTRRWLGAGLMIWPADRHLDLLASAGWAAFLPRLRRALDLFAEEPTPAHRADAERIADALLRVCPLAIPEEPTPLPEIIRELNRLPDRRHLTRLLNTVCPATTLDPAWFPLLVESYRTCDAWGGLVALTTEPHITPIETVGRLLVELLRARVPPARVRPAVESLVAQLPGELLAAKPSVRHAVRVADPAAAPVLLELLARLGDADFELTIIQRMLDRLTVWPLDGVLLPAVVALDGERAVHFRPGFALLRAVCVGHLNARVNGPPPARRGLQRGFVTRCRCGDCGRLGRFFLSATETSVALEREDWEISHILEAIQATQMDVTYTLVGKRRPRTLTLTKHDTPYEQAVAQRASDASLLAKLGDQPLLDDDLSLE